MTPAQKKVYMYIKEHLTQHHYAPSLSEIAKGIGMSASSKSLISRHVHALIKSGLLIKKPTGYRNIRLPLSRFQLPIVGKIAAGSPIEPVKQQAVLDLAEVLCNEGCYVLEVKGDSMIGEGIWDGDKIICKKQTTASEGDIVVALIDKEKATLKSLHYQPDGTILLAPANPQFKSQLYDANRITIQGIFIGLLRLPSQKIKTTPKMESSEKKTIENIENT
jgi:repressor LexA